MLTFQTKMGTLGGTICSLMIIPWTDIIKTIVLSGLGATVSFLISLLLQRIFRKSSKKT